MSGLLLVRDVFELLPHDLYDRCKALQHLGIQIDDFFHLGLLSSLCWSSVELVMQCEHFHAKVINGREGLLLEVLADLVGRRFASDVSSTVAEILQLYVHLFKLVQQVSRHFGG